MTESTARHILVVDDDTRIRTLLSWQLEAEGYAVRCTGDGAEGLERIGRDRPDLVILDLSLPGMGGLDVLRRVRQAEEPGGVTPLPRNCRRSMMGSSCPRTLASPLIQAFAPGTRVRVGGTPNTSRVSSRATR